MIVYLPLNLYAIDYMLMLQAKYYPVSLVG